jgi:hypothetical protein
MEIQMLPDVEAFIEQTPVQYRTVSVNSLPFHRLKGFMQPWHISWALKYFLMEAIVTYPCKP